MTRRDEYNPVAFEVPFDPDNDPNCDLVSENTQEAIEELCSKITTSASPGFSFGRSGSISANTWLRRPGNPPSNKTGINIGLTDPFLTKITVASQDLDTYDIEVWQHDGDEINSVLITTVSIVASRKEVFTLNVALTEDKQMAIKLVNGSAKNPGVDCQLAGTV